MSRHTQLEPRAAIFWLVDGKLICDATPISAAEAYGDCLGHAASHIAYWTKLQQQGTVPADLEYEDSPRGRVVYNKKTQQFFLYADRCILTRKAIVRKVIHDLRLPADRVVIGSDEHYRCYRCL